MSSDSCSCNCSSCSSTDCEACTGTGSCGECDGVCQYSCVMDPEAYISYYPPGSIDLILKNKTGVTLATTTCVPGKLDTNLLENGDYINVTIIKTFELLKTIKYNNSIIENIKYNLTASNVAFWLEQSITEYTTNLAQQVFAGTLSVDEFNKSVANYSKSIADKVPDNYSFILNKVDKAINDNLHILTDKPIVTDSSCGCSKPDKEPCGCKH